MEELDLIELFEIIWKKKIIIIIITIIAIIVGAIYTYMFVTPKYEAYTKIVLAQVSDISDENSSATAISTNDLTINQKLVSTYSEIIKSVNVLAEVKEKLGLNEPVEDIKKSIGVSAVDDAQVIQITVKNTDPEKAKNIANEIGRVFPEKVREYYNINNVSILDEATTPDTPYNINHKRDIIIFAFGGFVLSIAIILVINMLDNTISRAKDIEDVLNINVLATIPEYKQENKRKGGKKHGK